MDIENKEEKPVVLQIANDYFGTKLYKSLFNALAEKDIRNIVFIPIKKGQGMKANSTASSEMEKLIVTPCFSQFDRLLFFSKQKKIISEIKKNVNMGEINLIHAHTLFSAGYSALKLKKECGIPYITAVRNVDVNIFFEKIRFLRKTGIEIMREAAYIVFLSPAYRDTVLDNYVPSELRKSIETKCVVIPNGISPFFLENIYRNRKFDKGEIKLIYAGEINRNKNLRETIAAMKRLEKEGYNLSFTAVGDITDRRCSNILKDPLIKHIPRCGHEKLIEEYRKADIFVMPSITETFGLVYAEAMSQGLPVIYTRGQGFDKQFKEGYVGFSVDSGRPDELAENIKQIVDNYSAMSENCIKSCTRYSWSKIAEEYGGIYKRIKNE
ncbi:MAG: glycosyltransferase family 4 protein [Lachnospiraceae bacterium]|jgi:glycosyltransferase involved in cell wall biosynthesis|nr:glycosyltransferase family 4 protein [Lachnospiraceae bacterium]